MRTSVLGFLLGLSVCGLLPGKSEAQSPWEWVTDPKKAAVKYATRKVAEKVAESYLNDSLENGGQSKSKPSVAMSTTRVTPTGPTSIDTVLDPKIVEVERVGEVYSTIPGVSRTVSVIEEVKLGVTYTNTFEVGTEAGIDVKFVSAKIKASIGLKIGRTLEETTKISDSFTLNGTTVTAVRVVWCDKFYTGKVLVRKYGRTKEIPFRCRIGTKFRLEKVD